MFFTKKHLALSHVPCLLLPRNFNMHESIVRWTVWLSCTYSWSFSPHITQTTVLNIRQILFFTFHTIIWIAAKIWENWKHFSKKKPRKVLRHTTVSCFAVKIITRGTANKWNLKGSQRERYNTNAARCVYGLCDPFLWVVLKTAIRLSVSCFRREKLH